MKHALVPFAIELDNIDYKIRIQEAKLSLG